MKKFSIKESLDLLSIGRTTLYKHINKLGIEPGKVSNQSFLTMENIQRIQESLAGNFPPKNTEGEQPRTSEQKKQLEHSEQTNEQTPQPPKSDTSLAIASIREIYEKQVADLKTELTEERERNRQISLLLGQAQKEAEYKEKELLKLQEINQPTPEPEKPKKSWWQLWK